MKLIQRLALRYYKTKFRLWARVSKTKAAEKAFALFCTPQSRHRKKLPRIFEQAENLSFSMDGMKLQGWRFPPADQPAKRKALILHGYESSVTNFDRYVRPLLKKGYEVLAFDAPAHGRSEGKKVTAPIYKKMIQEIDKRYGPVQSYLAHSFGGLAVSLAMEEMKHDANHRIVLIAPATETLTAIDGFFRFLDLDPALREEFDKVIIKAGGVSPAWYSIRRAMKHIRAKVLWFQDEDDDITPLKDVLAVKNENYDHIDFVITKGLGHRRIYRDNKVSKAAIDFL